MRPATVALAVVVCSVLHTGNVGATQPLTLDVSPAVMQAPGFISVRARIEASDDNRWLEIVAESADFSRSSTVQLDGRRTPPLSIFEYSDLPPGMYEVRGLLVTTTSRRAAVSRLVKIVPAAGRWRR